MLFLKFFNVILFDTRKVCQKSLNLKSMEGNVLKSVPMVTEGDCGIELTRLIGISRQVG